LKRKTRRNDRANGQPLARNTRRRTSPKQSHYSSFSLLLPSRSSTTNVIEQGTTLATRSFEHTLTHTIFASVVALQQQRHQIIDTHALQHAHALAHVALQSEVEEVLDRIKGHKGVEGVILVNAEGIPIRPSK
jgi:hypothetical protein